MAQAMQVLVCHPSSAFELCSPVRPLFLLLFLLADAVADSGGVRGVQMHPPLAASIFFFRT